MAKQKFDVRVVQESAGKKRGWVRLLLDRARFLEELLFLGFILKGVEQLDKPEKRRQMIGSIRSTVENRLDRLARQQASLEFEGTPFPVFTIGGNPYLFTSGEELKSFLLGLKGAHNRYRQFINKLPRKERRLYPVELYSFKIRVSRKRTINIPGDNLIEALTKAEALLREIREGKYDVKWAVVSTTTRGRVRRPSKRRRGVMSRRAAEQKLFGYPGLGKGLDVNDLEKAWRHVTRIVVPLASRLGPKKRKKKRGASAILRDLYSRLRGDELQGIEYEDEDEDEVENLFDVRFKEQRAERLRPGVRRFPGAGTATGTVAHVTTSALGSIFRKVPGWAATRIKASAQRSAAKASEDWYDEQEKKIKREGRERFQSGEIEEIYRPENFKEVMDWHRKRARGYVRGARAGVTEPVKEIDVKKPSYRSLKDDVYVAAFQGAMSGLQNVLHRAKSPALRGIRLEIQRKPTLRALYERRIIARGMEAQEIARLTELIKEAQVSPARAKLVVSQETGTPVEKVSDATISEWARQTRAYIRMLQRSLSIKTRPRIRQIIRRRKEKSLLSPSRVLPRSVSNMSKEDWKEWNIIVGEVLKEQRRKMQGVIEEMQRASSERRQALLARMIVSEWGVSPEGAIFRGVDPGLKAEHFPLRVQSLANKMLKEGGYVRPPKRGRPTRRRAVAYLPAGAAPEGMPEVSSQKRVVVNYINAAGRRTRKTLRTTNQLIQWIRRRASAGNLPEVGEVRIFTGRMRPTKMNLKSFYGPVLVTAAQKARKARVKRAEVSRKRKAKIRAEARRKDMEEAKKKRGKKATRARGRVSRKKKAKKVTRRRGGITPATEETVRGVRRKRSRMVAGKLAEQGLPMGRPTRVHMGLHRDRIPTGEFGMPSGSPASWIYARVETQRGESKTLSTKASLLSYLRGKLKQLHRMRVIIAPEARVEYYEKKKGKKVGRKKTKRFNSVDAFQSWKRGVRGRVTEVKATYPSPKIFSGTSFMSAGEEPSAVRSATLHFVSDEGAKTMRLPGTWKGIFNTLERMAANGVQLDETWLTINGRRYDVEDFMMARKSVGAGDVRKVDVRQYRHELLPRVKRWKLKGKRKKRKPNVPFGLVPHPVQSGPYSPGSNWKARRVGWV